MAEHSTVNRVVPGSSPGAGAKEGPPHRGGPSSCHQGGSAEGAAGPGEVRDVPGVPHGRDPHTGGGAGSLNDHAATDVHGCVVGTILEEEEQITRL